MIILALLASAADLPQRAMAWEGTADVYVDGKPLQLGVRTRLAKDGSVVSESWPIAQGKEKGMHRMVIDASGGWMEVGGKRNPMPAEMLAEERAQYGFYRQLQIADSRVSGLASQGVNTFSVEGPVRTWFRLGPDGKIASATNVLPHAGANGGPAYQTFEFDRLNRAGEHIVYPGVMRMYRDGKPYFTLRIRQMSVDGG